MAFIIDDLLFGVVAKYLIPMAGDAIASLFADDADAQAAKAVTATVAGAAVKVAQQVTGVPITDEASAQAAATALQSDSTKQAEFQRQMADQALQAYRAETERLNIVNETIRVEAHSSDPYVRRWRPYWGYMSARAWMAQTVAICLALIGATVAAMLGHAAAAKEVLAGIAALIEALSGPWMVALAVLGIGIVQRSKDKAGGAGGMLGGLLEALPQLGRKGR